jgi:hypothetical protein
MRVILLGGLLLLSVVEPPTTSLTDLLETLRVVALAPASGAAAICGETGEIVLVAPGDRILEAAEGREIRVREVLPDRLVVEIRAKGSAAPGIRAWVYPVRAGEPAPRRPRILEPQPPRQVESAPRPSAGEPLPAELGDGVRRRSTSTEPPPAEPVAGAEGDGR